MPPILKHFYFSHQHEHKLITSTAKRHNILALLLMTGCTFHPGTGDKKPHIVCSSFRNPDRSESTHHSTVDFVNFTIPLTCVVNVWIEDKSSSNMVGLDAEQVQVYISNSSSFISFLHIKLIYS